jgi:hypothetical protein
MRSAELKLKLSQTHPSDSPKWENPNTQVAKGFPLIAFAKLQRSEVGD